MGRTPCCNAEGLKKGAWTSDEDQKLIGYIQEHGEGGWRTLPQKAGLQRCGKSCRLRWANYLRPDIKRGEFSTEEEQKIIQLHASLGNRWSAIARHLPKRTDNEIKNYWNTHLKKRLADMGIDPITHNPIGPSPSNHSPTHMPRDSRSDDISPLPTSGFGFSSGSSSNSTSAQLLNKLASKLAPSLKTTPDLLSNNNKNVIVDAESSSPVSSSLDYPTTRRVSTSTKLLNKMASRLNNTLKSILSRSTDQDYNNNYDNNNDNYLQRCASASRLSESTSDISRSISTSNNGGGLINNNQDDDSSVTPLLDPLDLDFDLLKDWHVISDGGLSSTSIGVTYNGEPSMCTLNFNNDASRISGGESAEFQDLLYLSSGGDVNDVLLVTATETTTTSYDNEMAIRTSHDILDMGQGYKEHYFADGFSNLFIGDDSNMVNRESHFGGDERAGSLLQEANSTNYWNADFSNFESYGVLSDSI